MHFKPEIAVALAKESVTVLVVSEYFTEIVEVEVEMEMETEQAL